MMEDDSPPSSPNAPDAPDALDFTHVPTPTHEITPTSPHTFTPTTATPITSSTSGESLIGFEFSHAQDSRDESSDDSSGSRRVVCESPDSFIPPVGSYDMKETTPPSSAEEIQLDLSDQDALDDVRGEGFPAAPGGEIRDAVFLEFSSPEEGECGTPPPPPMPGDPGVPGAAYRDKSVPLELAAQYEVPGMEGATHSPVSLPSQSVGETAPAASPFGKLISNRESVLRGNLSETDVASFHSDSDGGKAETEVAKSSASFTRKTQSASRPQLKRHQKLLGDDPPSKHPSPLTPSREEVRTESYALSGSSGVITLQQDESAVKSENKDRKVASVRAKRYRKKGLGLSLSLDLGDCGSDTNQGQLRGHPQLRPQYSLDERHTQKPSYVALSLEEGSSDSHLESWDHGELEDDSLESMKIEKDKWKGSDIPRGHKSRPLYRPKSGVKGNKETVGYVIDEDSESGIRKNIQMGGEGDPSHDNNSNIKKGLKVKSVLYRVNEETNEVMEEEVNRGSAKEKKAPPKDLGHENRAFVDDEQDTVSQEENNSPDQNQQETTVDVSRRRSNPECLLAIPKSEEIPRSHSYGMELDKVMNNLNGEQGQQTLATPTLRKRSTSRGRPENDEGKENSNQDESPPSTSKKDSHFVSFGPTFSYGGDERSTSNIFQKLVSNPIMKLTRSESTKSHMGVRSGREEGLARSVSNIWEGGVKTKGSGSSSHHGRPPQAPSSLPRDDHRHHSHKNYLLQQHLYRNSRRNMQQKLLRQLSDVHFDDHRYSSGSDAHHSSRYDYSHKKHDSHHPDHHSNHGRHNHTDHHSNHGRHNHTDHHSNHGRHNHTDHHSSGHGRHNVSDHHGGGSHGRHNHNHHDSPSASSDHRHHHPPHHHGGGGGGGGGGYHHHRSQSQRHLHRPKHEPLRRLNTYGHEEYHKYVQEREHRYEQEMAREQAREHSTEHSREHPGEHSREHSREHPQRHSQRHQGHGEGKEGNLKPQEDEAVRRISHYRQEEKGKTDVERWVGVHGDQPTEGTPAQPLLPSPGTPHIVVSPEDSGGKNNQLSQADNEIQQLNTPGSNGPIFPNAQSTPAPPPTPANNTEERRSRPDKLSMTTLDLPDGREGFYKKTRRNSINEMHRRFSTSQTNLQRSSSVTNIQRSNSHNSLAPSVLDWKQEGNDALIACLSALYGKLLVVMGMAFPIAEVISHDIPVTFYYGFYLYLYIGSIIFLVYAYLFLLHSINIPTEQLKSKIQSVRSLMTIPGISMVLPHRNSSKQEGNIASRDSRISASLEVDKESDRASVNTVSYKTPKYTLTESNNHGSMYLKMGAVLFGIGSMIYSGLEVGQYFELKTDDNCADILLAISPAARMLFTFIQMYFIFLNSRVAISRHRVIARFGLMHMIGTNLCIWLNVLVQETKHEIINLTLGPGGHHHGGELTPGSHHGAAGAGHHSDSAAILGHNADVINDTVATNHTFSLANATTHEHNTHDLHDIHQTANDSHNLVRREVTHHQALSIYECRRSDLMGELVDEASPFLFPCTIEYSLLCAGVLYVIWKNINKPEVAYDGDSDISTYIARKARHHYSVDCAHANRGLFMGILVLVLTIISLILFFVLINNEAYKEVAILEANIIELSVYGVASVTVIIGMIQMRELEFIPEGDIELDNILLLIAQSGVYIYTSFTVIGGHFTMTDNLILPLLSAIITLLQTTLQTIFILDASRRCCYNQDQLQRKPGREMVTFLLVCNLAMWAINTFETSRADAHPTQLNFYGIWAWTIISHISMPLAIFYRFHVTVCLCEIWKRSYKLRNDY